MNLPVRASRILLWLSLCASIACFTSVPTVLAADAKAKEEAAKAKADAAKAKAEAAAKKKEDDAKKKADAAAKKNAAKPDDPHLLVIRVESTTEGRVMANGIGFGQAPNNVVVEVDDRGRLTYDVRISVGGGRGGGGGGGAGTRGVYYEGSVPPAKISINNGIYTDSREPATLHAKVGSVPAPRQQ